MSRDGSNSYISERIDVRTVEEMDADDDSLRKYASHRYCNPNFISPPDDPRKFVIQSIVFMFCDRPDGNLGFYNLDCEEKWDSFKNASIVLKEGCEYSIRVSFKVQHEIISGLTCRYKTLRRQIPQRKGTEMLGSFAPQVDEHHIVLPKQGWDIAPTGMINRDLYTTKVAFVDDDKNILKKYKFSFEIKKNWY